MSTIDEFRLAIPDSVLADLRTRLQQTRWPERETVNDWTQGAPLERVRELCHYWATNYDWRRCEARLNAFGQFRTNLNGLGIHFLHVRSSRRDAIPLLLTHGWPGSIIEFLEVLDPLTDPAAHGAGSAPAFHVVAPSLPGFGFSDKPAATGWGVERIAAAWVELMRRLGYQHFVAQGGDWGSTITTALAMARTPECVAVHLTMPLVFPTAQDMADLTPAEEAAVRTLQSFDGADSGYAKQQSTRPQTLAYGLTDSPAGQAAWIYEKFHAWTDNDGTAESAVDRDALLDNIMLYWLPAAAGSSARLYWESLHSFKPQPLVIPVGVSVFPKETIRPSRRWADRCYSNIIHWNELASGGHFAALEQPDIFVQEIRDCFGKVRAGFASKETPAVGIVAP